MGIAQWIAVGMAVSGTAEAAVSDISHAGAWDAFEGTVADGTPVCGVSTGWSDGRGFSIKVYGSDDYFTVQLVKPSWSIPAGTQLPVIISFGAFPPFATNATGNQTVIELKVDPSQNAEFGRDYTASSTFAISFPSGSEPAWGGTLSGSGAVGNALSACINMLPGHSPTQPFSTRPQAPAQPSQPFQQQSSPAPPIPLTPPPEDGLNHV